MKPYRHDTMKPAVAGFAATFACAGTLAAFVLLPAASACPDTLLAKRQSAPIEVAIVPGKIEVIGVRARTTAAEVANPAAGQS